MNNDVQIEVESWLRDVLLEDMDARWGDLPEEQEIASGHSFSDSFLTGMRELLAASTKDK